jgi:hypothetical protein
MGQVVDCLPSKHMAQTSNPNATKKLQHQFFAVDTK